jgi:hypothetical protein
MHEKVRAFFAKNLRKGSRTKDSKRGSRRKERPKAEQRASNSNMAKWARRCQAPKASAALAAEEDEDAMPNPAAKVPMLMPPPLEELPKLCNNVPAAPVPAELPLPPPAPPVPTLLPAGAPGSPSAKKPNEANSGTGSRKR